MKTLIILIILNLIIKVLTEPQLNLGGILTSSTEPQSQKNFKDALVQQILTREGLNGFRLGEVHVSNRDDDDDKNLSSKENVLSSYKNQNCMESKTLVKSQKTCKGQLIFEDNFQYNHLDTRMWTKEIRIPSDYDDADFVSYQDLPENCYIKDDHLYIVPTLLANTNGFNSDSIRSGTLDFGERCTAISTNSDCECSRSAKYSRILPPIVSARIGTRRKFSFRYGHVEIKAKLPKGDWIFPQLLLEPYSTKPYGDYGYASGQIRIAFNRGNDILVSKNKERIDGFRLYGGVVLTVGDEHRDKFLINKLHHNHLSDDYHIYSMIWTNESIAFHLDGVEYGKINGGFSNDPNLMNLKPAEKWKNSGFMAPFDQEFFISVGVSAGGMSDFPDGCKYSRHGKPKPWINNDPKGELVFWKNQTNWYPTWNGEDAALIVDYIRVWTLS